MPCVSEQVSQIPPQGDESVNYRRECVFVEKLLYATDVDGSIFTLPGFYNDIVRLVGKNLDTLEIEDFRSPMPPPDWEEVKKIKLRDYQKEPMLDLVFKGMEDSGVINATGASERPTSKPSHTLHGMA